jgi:hypothetical protein
MCASNPLDEQISSPLTGNSLAFEIGPEKLISPQKAPQQGLARSQIRNPGRPAKAFEAKCSSCWLAKVAVDAREQSYDNAPLKGKLNSKMGIPIRGP